MSAAGSFVVLERQGQARGYRQWLTPPSEGDAPQPSSLDLQLVEIPAGSFLMGSPASEEGHQADEGPQHEVKLESFFLGCTPITQAQWREVAQWQEGPGEHWGCTLNPNPSRFMGDKGGLFPAEANTDNRPVERVSWRDAMEFCSRLSQRSGNAIMRHASRLTGDHGTRLVHVGYANAVYFFEGTAIGDWFGPGRWSEMLACAQVCSVVSQERMAQVLATHKARMLAVKSATFKFNPADYQALFTVIHTTGDGVLLVLK
jgi:hypothetical protein